MSERLNWAKKNVLVTGGSGFLGSTVVKLLRKKNPKSIIVPSSTECDLTKLSNCKRIVKGIDVVFHIAGRAGGIGLNRQKPAELLYDNLLMGTQLIDEAKKADVQKMIIVGTVCSYPKFAPIPFKEESIWDGYPEETNAAYGLAKKMLMVQSQAYRQEYNFKSIYVIPTNLYGPNDNFDPSRSHVIPALILKIHNAIKRKSNTITVWGDGSATRDFLYVDDAAKGIILSAENYDDVQPINLGSGQEVSIKEMVNIISKLMHYKGTIEWDTSKPNGQPRRCVDIERAKERLGFVPSVLLREGLKRTIDWFNAEFVPSGRATAIENG